MSKDVEDFFLNATGLESLLTPKQTASYLKLLGLSRKPPTLEFLTEIIQRTYAKIPFQNLTMLTRPKIPPKKEEIVEDMLSGIGGLCTTINPFFCALSHALDFQIGLLMVSLTKPNCHIGLIVIIEKKKYWVDLGNGFPYLQPLPLELGAEGRRVGFHWRLLKDEDTWCVEQTILGSRASKVNQCFQAISIHYSRFSEMQQCHYTQPEFGPFLTGIRINRWTTKQGFLLRDKLIWNFPNNKQKADLEETKNWVREQFEPVESRLIPLLEKSWYQLNFNKQP